MLKLDNNNSNAAIDPFNNLNNNNNVSNFENNYLNRNIPASGNLDSNFLNRNSTNLDTYANNYNAAPMYNPYNSNWNGSPYRAKSSTSGSLFKNKKNKKFTNTNNYMRVGSSSDVYGGNHNGLEPLRSVTSAPISSSGAYLPDADGRILHTQAIYRGRFPLLDQSSAGMPLNQTEALARYSKHAKGKRIVDVRLAAQHLLLNYHKRPQSQKNTQIPYRSLNQVFTTQGVPGYPPLMYLVHNQWRELVVLQFYDHMRMGETLRLLDARVRNAKAGAGTRTMMLAPNTTTTTTVVENDRFEVVNNASAPVNDIYINGGPGTTVIENSHITTTNIVSGNDYMRHPIRVEEQNREVVYNVNNNNNSSSTTNFIEDTHIYKNFNDTEEGVIDKSASNFNYKAPRKPSSSLEDELYVRTTEHVVVPVEDNWGFERAEEEVVVVESEDRRVYSPRIERTYLTTNQTQTEAPISMVSVKKVESSKPRSARQVETKHSKVEIVHAKRDQHYTNGMISYSATLPYTAASYPTSETGAVSPRPPSQQQEQRSYVHHYHHHHHYTNDAPAYPQQQLLVQQQQQQQTRATSSAARSQKTTTTTSTTSKKEQERRHQQLQRMVQSSTEHRPSTSSNLNVVVEEEKYLSYDKDSQTVRENEKGDIYWYVSHEVPEFDRSHQNWMLASSRRSSSMDYNERTFLETDDENVVGNLQGLDTSYY